MYCYQCEETAKGCGCTTMGVCGKDAETAGLQDVLIYLAKGIAVRNLAAMEKGTGNGKAGRFIAEVLFATLTNVNFDKERFHAYIREAISIRDALPPAGEIEPDACTWTPADDAAIAAKAGEVGVLATANEDVRSLRELLVYGLKGVGAYYYHADALGYEDDEITAFIQRALASTLQDLTLDEMVGIVLECGGVGVRVLALLDTANTATFGAPEITMVRTAPGTRPGILVTGHDLKDLRDLLEQTKGAGVDVYTHGEMLPCNAYPGLKKFPHLAGNYGGAWQDQQKEFDSFPGAILMTTNCIQKPRDTYIDRIFTTGLVAFPGVTHLGDKNFKPVIDAALAAPGFAESEPERFITVGFGRNAVMSVAGTVIDAVKSGAIRHFFLVGGCDGAKSGRNYYTDFARAVPDDCVILTLACGKYRFNKLEFGDIGGIPRLLDMGQCNDAYSAIVVASALAEAFGVGVNDLPLSMILSWYEQKAVAILLTLLHLGITNIKLGPSLPACLTPATLGVLVNTFGIAPVTTAEQDLKEILG